MIKVLFVCHGNICRSPMAEFVLKDMVRKRGVEERFYIASAAVSREELLKALREEGRLKPTSVQKGSEPLTLKLTSNCTYLITVRK